MSQITITIIKAEVMAEVMRTSAYLGTKSKDTADYERKALINHDKDELERYWRECRSLATGRLSQLLVEDRSGDDYVVTLSPSLSWNESMLPSVTASLRGYLVNGVLAKWLMVADPASVEGYARVAASMLDDAEAMLYRLKRPERRV